MRLGDHFLVTTLLDGPAMTADEVICHLVSLLSTAGHLPSSTVPAIQASILQRERLRSTGIGLGFALPHTAHDAVPCPLGVLAVCHWPIDFRAVDGEPVDLFFLSVFPPHEPALHLERLQGTTGHLKDTRVAQRLREVASAEELDELVRIGNGYMTHNEWLSATNPKPMIRYLLGTDGRVQDITSFPDCVASRRKLRLFACACYHRIRHLLRSGLAQEAVEVAERFADDTASLREFREIGREIQIESEAMEPPWRASRGVGRTAMHPVYAALALAGQTLRPHPQQAAYYASSNAYLDSAGIRNPGVAQSHSGFSSTRMAEERAQTILLRCIFGDPFRPVAVEPTWRQPLVQDLAAAAYEERCPDGALESHRLAVLADALEDAGCTNAIMLSHLRDPGPHYRGCWAVDLLSDRT